MDSRRVAYAGILLGFAGLHACVLVFALRLFFSGYLFQGFFLFCMLAITLYLPALAVQELRKLDDDEKSDD